MKQLYKYKKTRDTGGTTEDFGDAELKIVTPKIFVGCVLPGEKPSLEKILTRMMFSIITFGKSKIFYVVKDGKTVHTSIVVLKCYKFGYMGEYDYEIGPCFTSPQQRGQGIYPKVLKSICRSVGNENTTFYMHVDDMNISSARGVEKAGFVRLGKINKTKITKKYYL